MKEDLLRFLYLFITRDVIPLAFAIGDISHTVFSHLIRVLDLYLFSLSGKTSTRSVWA